MKQVNQFVEHRATISFIFRLRLLLICNSWQGLSIICGSDYYVQEVIYFERLVKLRYDAGYGPTQNPMV